MKRQTVEEFINMWSKAVLGKGLTFDVWFPSEETLGMLLVPSSGALSLKVIYYTKRAKEKFFIGQLLRWSGMQLLYVAFLQTF